MARLAPRVTRRFLACAFWVALSSGCGTDIVARVPDETLPAPSPGKAQVVFLRPSSYFPAMGSFLYEVRDGSRVFISAIQGYNKVLWDAQPGETLFESNNGVMAHFLSAELVAGRRYFVLVRPIHGYGFQLRPLRTDGTTEYNTSLSDFPSWVASTQRVEPTEGARSLSTHRDFADMAAKGRAEFDGKSAEQKAELTLRASDGAPP
jgi:hypothetical protein